MYLTKKHYVFSDDRENLKIEGVDKYNINPEKVHEISEEVAYWRKANQIHKWFVDNVQKGVDNCDEYSVSTGQLRELLEKVTKVIEDPKMAGLFLPTQAGFFFGSTEYDQYYMDDMQETKKTLEKILETAKDDDDFVYRSSW